jgi:AcrR family transcriptional regulator
MSESSDFSNKKYQKLITTAHELFWKHGFRRVSIEEICRKAGISKMTYYRFFPNKIELAKSVFDQVVDEGVRKFKIIMASEISPSEKIKKILLLKLEGTNDISQEFLQDFYRNPELGLAEYIEEKTRNSWNEILSDFKHAQQSGWFRNDMKPEFLYYFSQRLAEVLTDEKLMKLYDTPQDLVMELTNFFTYGISPHD